MDQVRASAVLEFPAAQLGGIRRAESSDIDTLIELAWVNALEGEYKNQIVYDKLKLSMFVGAILVDDNARFFVWDERGAIQGMFAFAVFPNFYYFGGQMIANMVIWSVAREHRGRKSIALLRAAEEEARQMGAKKLLLTGPGFEFRNLVDHCGYKYLETSFVKELS